MFGYIKGGLFIDHLNRGQAVQWKHLVKYVQDESMNIVKPRMKGIVMFLTSFIIFSSCSYFLEAVNSVTSSISIV